MTLKFLTFGVIFCICITGRSQEALLQTDARSAAMGFLFAVPDGRWSCLSNPAGIASEKSAGIGILYNNYYNLPETGTGAVVLIIPAKPGNFGIGFLSSGFSSIKETRGTLAYCRTIGEKLRAGISLTWFHYNQPEDYTDLYTWIPSLGIQWFPAKKWFLGLTVINPASQEYYPKGYRNIPMCLIAGTGFKPSEEFLLILEAQKIADENLRIAMGIEAIVIKNLFMRFGINRQNFATWSAGAGYRNLKMSFDASACHHPVLGFSPALSFNLSF